MRICTEENFMRFVFLLLLVVADLNHCHPAAGLAMRLKISYAGPQVAQILQQSWK